MDFLSNRVNSLVVVGFHVEIKRDLSDNRSNRRGISLLAGIFIHQAIHTLNFIASRICLNFFQ